MNEDLILKTNSNETHFNAEYNGEICHFQLTDNELNQDSVIFTANLAKLLGLYTIDYHKYNSDAEKFYVYSKFIDFEKLTDGNVIINSYNINEIKKEFILKKGDKGENFFKQFCQMIILDIFTLNCDRTHNNWLIENDNILIYDYNFTFGSAGLLHGVTNYGLSKLLFDGINEELNENLVSDKNKFLYERFNANHGLDLIDFAEYIIQKSTRDDTAHTKADNEEIRLIPNYIKLIRYFTEENIELDLINKIMNLSAESVFESIPCDSKISSYGNQKYLSYIFNYIKNLIKK